MTEQEYKGVTLDHIIRVRELLHIFVMALAKRGNVHDASKLKEPEADYFRRCTPLLDEYEYGTDEYKKGLELLGPALDHHYENNDHHPEHFPERKDEEADLIEEIKEVLGEREFLDTNEREDLIEFIGPVIEARRSRVNQMNLFQIVEMFCDHIAGSERNKNGDPYNSLEHNKKRFKMSKQLENIFRNTLDVVVEDEG